MQLNSSHYYFHSPIYSHHSISLTSKRSWNALTMRKPSWHPCFSCLYNRRALAAFYLKNLSTSECRNILHSWLLIKNWIAIRYQCRKVKVHSTRFLFILFYYFCLWRGNLREANWRTYKKRRFSRWCACQTHKLLYNILVSVIRLFLWWFMLFIFFR